MVYSSSQLAAIAAAEQALLSAGLTANDLHGHLNGHDYTPHSSSVSPPSVYSDLTPPLPAPARLFTAQEISSRLNRLNRESVVHAIADHAIGTLVEYPETGALHGEAVLHRFHIDSDNFLHPKDNFQYSLGSNGGHPSRLCFFLTDPQDGTPVPCSHVRSKCQGLKTCDFREHTMATAGLQLTIRHSHSSDAPSTALDARRELFEKTFGFYCAIRDAGCAFAVEHNAGESTAEVEEDGSDDGLSGDEVMEMERDCRAPESRTCRGCVVMCIDNYNHAFLQCEHRKKGQRAHLIIRDLTAYNMNYLMALFHNDRAKFSEIELNALTYGYGPLVPCNFADSPRNQKQRCPQWRRYADGSLRRGTLQRHIKCHSTFDIYVPHDIKSCAYIVIVCRHPHSHPDPLRTKTPPLYLHIFRSLLCDLQWRLADATPRKISTDVGLVAGLRRVLNWTTTHDPVLSDLHPSFGNQDHVARLIDTLRQEYYPMGTDFEGVRRLAEEHSRLPLADQYVRAVREVTLVGDLRPLRIVVCMFPEMSSLLMDSKRPSIDTSFRRVSGWEEFEIQTWNDETAKSVVCARAFITSQSAAAHLTLFKLIFDIAESDTGRSVHFFHIHGVGIDTVSADAHKGQALGFGQFLQYLCQSLVGMCPIEPERPLKSLGPYEHLKRCFRVCNVHYKRGVWVKRTQLTPTVRQAMLSLLSSDDIPDWDGTLAIIRNGGKVAQAWLTDKEKTPFAWAAIYRPKSLISRERWLAAPPDTNSNEQGHRDINRDGVQLSLLAGVEIGSRYDGRAMSAYRLHQHEQVSFHDTRSTHAHRSRRAILRAVNIQRRQVDQADAHALELKSALQNLHPQIARQATLVASKRVGDGDTQAIERAVKRLKSLEDQQVSLRADLHDALNRGSGRISHLPAPHNSVAHRSASGTSAASSSLQYITSVLPSPPTSLQSFHWPGVPPFHAGDLTPVGPSLSPHTSLYTPWARQAVCGLTGSFQYSPLAFYPVSEDSSRSSSILHGRL
ncbi:hypothetical protein BKA93DRAFT_732739 [Sparassis latifolia]